MKRELACAEALRIVAAMTRAGDSLETAVLAAGRRTKGEVGLAFCRAGTALQLGRPLDSALGEIGQKLDSSIGSQLVEILALQQRSGGDIGRVCQRLAFLLHEHARLQDEARSVTAQSRFAARAVVALPMVAALGWVVTSPESFKAVFATSLLWIVSPSFILMACGIWGVRRISATASDQTGKEQISKRDSRAVDKKRLSARTNRRLLLLSMSAVPPILMSSIFSLSHAVLLGAAVAGSAWIARMRLSNADKNVRAALHSSLPGLCELSLAILEAGGSVREAVEMSIDLGPQPLRAWLAPARAQILLGKSMETAVAQSPATRHVPELLLWSSTLIDSDRRGVSAEPALETLISDFRSTEREQFRSRAATAAPRIQLVTVLCIVPSIVWIVLVATATGLVRELQQSGIA